MSGKLSRIDFIRYQHAEAMGQFDELDQKALEGLRYLDAGEDVSVALERIDRRIKPLLGTRYASPRPVRSILVRRIFQAAAIVLVLIAAIFFLKPDRTSRLYDQYFTLAPNIYYQITRSAEPLDEDEFITAFSAYERGQFDRAEVLIGQLILDFPEKLDLPFYLAIVYMANNKTDKAIPVLQECMSVSYRDVGDLAVWYLALAKLKTSDHNGALDLLQLIVERDLPNAPAAKELIQALR